MARGRLTGQPRFEDRSDAGRQLSQALAHHRHDDAVVLGLPRGGVPVAAEVARALGMPLDVFVVRKLGVPGHEELALGAIGSGGVRVLNQDVLGAAGLSELEVAQVTARELTNLEARERAFRGSRPPLALAGRTAILVDDGLATGATMRVAVQAVRAGGPSAVVVAVPVAPVQTAQALASEVSELVCLLEPDPFIAVGVWYRDFTAVSDEEVQTLLHGVGGGEPTGIEPD